MKSLYSFIASLLIASLLIMPSRVMAVAPNLIDNPSVETASGSVPTGFRPDTWGTNTSTFSYPNEGHTGTHSLRVDTTAYTNGDAKWQFAPVAVSPNTEYTYTNWYKSSAYTDLLAEFTAANGTVSYKWLKGINASTNWKQLSVTFATPADAAKVTIFQIMTEVGYMQIDDFSLTANTVEPPAPVTPGQNAVPNAGLETVTSGMPQNWQKNNPKNNAVSLTIPTNGHSGGRSVKATINTYTAGDVYWSFAEQLVNGGVLYEFSDWYKSNVDTDVYAQVTMQDGSQRWIYIGTAWHSPNWNHFDQQFVMPAGAVSATVYHSLYQVGWIQSDDYALVQYTPQGFSRGIVSLTFDDGIASTYTNGFPLLEQYGLDATFYITNGFTNTSYYMTLDQLKALRDAGHEIGGHTVTHPELIKLTNTQINTELQKSRNNLQTWLGVNVANFATPHGEYNSNVLTYAKKYYTSHRSVDVGFNSRENFDIYNIKVQNVVASTTTAQILDWVNQAYQQHTWLVLVYHAVDANTSIPDANWNTLPTDLNAQLAGIKASGITVLPVNAALSEIKPQL